MSFVISIYLYFTLNFTDYKTLHCDLQNTSAKQKLWSSASFKWVIFLHSTELICSPLQSNTPWQINEFRLNLFNSIETLSEVWFSLRQLCGTISRLNVNIQFSSATITTGKLNRERQDRHIQRTETIITLRPQFALNLVEITANWKVCQLLFSRSIINCSIDYQLTIRQWQRQF